MSYVVIQGIKRTTNKVAHFLARAACLDSVCPNQEGHLSPELEDIVLIDSIF